MSLTSGSLDYIQFCGVAMPVKVLSKDERISAKSYADHVTLGNHLLVDVREKVQFDLCNLDGSINVPMSDFQSGQAFNNHDKSSEVHPSWVPKNLPNDAPIFVVCRLGNDSQLVVKQMKERGMDKDGSRFIGDIEGGLLAWKRDVDPRWPEY
jgi:adenylyltransferase/sulfurtransferase